MPLMKTHLEGEGGVDGHWKHLGLCKYLSSTFSFFKSMTMSKYPIHPGQKSGEELARWRARAREGPSDVQGGSDVTDKSSTSYNQSKSSDVTFLCRYLEISTIVQIF